jgi:integrase
MPAKVKGVGPYVFSTNNGHTPISGFGKFKAGLDQAVLEELRKADPDSKPLPNWTVHDLRRTARTLLSRAGIAVDHGERCLGHKKTGVRGVYDRYEYYEEKHHAYEALANMIKSIIDPRPANVTDIRRRGHMQ